MATTAQTVNEVVPPQTRPLVDFTWSPTGGVLSWTAGGNTYPYTHQADSVSRATDANYADNVTPTNTLITFVAAVTPPTGLTILEYQWDFEDGIIGYGSTITHTYFNAIPSAAATLIVTDSLNRKTTRRKNVNLRVLAVLTAKEGVRVV